MKPKEKVSYNIVRGAVFNTIKNHPEYFTDIGKYSAPDGIAKRAAIDLVKTLQSNSGASAKAEN